MEPTENLDPRWGKAVTGVQVFVLAVEPVAEGQKPEEKDLEAFSFQKIVVLWWLASGQFLTIESIYTYYVAYLDH